MGWRERDWARFNADEWQAVYGGSPPSARAATAPDRVRVVVWGTLGVAVIALALAALVARSSAVDAPAIQPVLHTSVVYAGRTARWRDAPGHLACTAEAVNTLRGGWTCTEWTMLRDGQRAVAARDSGGPCGARHVDQRTGSWVCDSLEPPRPESLPGAVLSTAT